MEKMLGVLSLIEYNVIKNMHIKNTEELSYMIKKYYGV